MDHNRHTARAQRLYRPTGLRLQRFLADEAADEFELMPAVDCMRISLGQSKDQNGQGEADERLPLLAADSSPSNTEEPSQESFENHTDSSKPPS